MGGISLKYIWHMDLLMEPFVIWVFEPILFLQLNFIVNLKHVSR